MNFAHMIDCFVLPGKAEVALALAVRNVAVDTAQEACIVHDLDMAL